jgi:hypothetical protein
MPEAFEKILMRYPRLTEEVMEFAGFRSLDAMPSFSIHLG